MRSLLPHWHLLYQLTRRDLRTRYTQTFLGPAWVFARPVVELGVYVVVFGVFFRAPSDGVPYGLFAYSGIVMWTFVAGGLGRGARSVTGHAGLVSQAPFPTVVLPGAALAGALIDTLVAAAILAAWLAWRGVWPSAEILWLLPIGLVTAAIVSGLALLVAALSVFYRDITYLVDVGLRIWLLLTPVAYAPSAVPQAYRAWYGLNPLVPLFGGMRRAIFGGPPPDAAALWYPALAGVLLLLAGALVFRATQASFAEAV